MPEPPPNPTRRDRQRFIIGGPSTVPLNPVAAAVESDPAVDLVRTHGSGDDLHLLVVEMTPDRAESLRQQFPGIIIEPDEPLHLNASRSRRVGGARDASSASGDADAMPTDTADTDPTPPTPAGSATSATRSAGTPPPAPAAGVGPTVAPAAAGPAVPAGPPERPLDDAPRVDQFLVARSSGPLPAGVEPFDLNQFEQIIRQQQQNPGSGMKLVKVLHPPALGAFGTDLAAGSSSVVVAQMPEQSADALRRNLGGRVMVERDHPVSYSQPQPPGGTAVAHDPGVLAPYGVTFTVLITVRGRGGAAISAADVYLYGSLWPTQGKTDAAGQVTLTLFGETGTNLRGLYVKPEADYWSYWNIKPALDPAANNVVNLIPLDQQNTVAGFPGQQLVGWGLKAMKVDQLPPQYRGQGVRIALVDSGAAVQHQDLVQRFKGGFDTITQDAMSWTQDTVFHGTHCAGVSGALNHASGIRGIAPDAELYSYKIFPDGRFSNLIDALNKCIEQEVDVVNLSLGSDQQSALVEQKIQEAKAQGIACIVAAGNAGGPVQYPAASSNVLAIAALGKFGTFPDSSYHSAVPVAGVPPSADGYFPANFSCHGPEIGVAAPGVAIVSSVPPNNYAAWDGTSMAAPHVTGLAALVLAHHPDFQPGGPFAARNGARVERLFAILKQSCDPLNFGDPTRAGAGLPNALRALGVPPAAAGDAVPAAMFQQFLTFLQGGGTQSTRPAAAAPSLGRLGTQLASAGLAAAPTAAAAAGVSPMSAVPIVPANQIVTPFTEGAPLQPPGPQRNGAGEPGQLVGADGAAALLQRLKTQLRAAGLLAADQG